jgi:hypothetical protein
MDSDEAVTADARAALATAFADRRELDGDRAAGVFGVLATGFAVLLGFIVFLSFTSYDQSRTGAETEARMVVISSATGGRSFTRSGSACARTRSATPSTRGASSSSAPCRP